ncbi:BTB/POZ domain-containing protein 7 [Melanaphis sacchari]|uniref:BTB/POZ domain-containing protein 7 n=1 Tax=Melanaphis sacchari TaxID=742174 RepID=A0A2H8TTI9_9HEMI|nr:BTB/POZ domain-containing protein 7 [Melanaphis sacchari]
MNLCFTLLPCVWSYDGMTKRIWPDDRMGAGVSSNEYSNVDVQNYPGVIIKERRKMRMSGFATLRKKLIKRRRYSKVCNHGRVIRELISDWSPAEVTALLEEYEALAALKDLSVQAELARPPAATFKQDLSTLYDHKYCTDVDLIFRGVCFPVHRAILSARCPYFRELLLGCPGYGARICLDLRTPGVDIEMFSALLRFLYTGDIAPRDGDIDLALLRRLGDELGTPNVLENDLRYLLETGDYADAALVFIPEGYSDRRPESTGSEYGFQPKLELPCHKSILSARSPFFRNLIQRRTKSGEEHTERALHIPTRIVLDESVIPKRYARVLLHAIYLDTVDLSLILRGSGCGSSAGSLSEVEALTNTGRVRPSPLDEAMELYQIGRFLELEIVSQGCEDLILEWLTLESLPGVLRWGNLPHGSAWVHRQAKHFLREEFSQVANSPVLYQLDKAHLIDCLKSNFLQSSELEVLQAVLKWGEHELIRRMEDREPNLVSQTTHSVSRKGVKKRDLSDVELREILSELLPLVRMDHVIPTEHETLTQAIRRGLVSSPPSHMIGNDSPILSHHMSRINAWIRHPSGLYVRPRLFIPYYDEIKSLFEDQMLREDEELVRRTRYMPDGIPDTLYMIEEKPTSLSYGLSSLDVLTASIPTPDVSTMNAMVKRDQKLRSAPGCQRAISLPLSSRQEINHQIRLRVVREFNLPDPVAYLLEKAASSVCYCGGGPDEKPKENTRSRSSRTRKEKRKGLGTSTLPSVYAQQKLRKQPRPYVVNDMASSLRYTNNIRYDDDEDFDGRGEQVIMPDVAAVSLSLDQLNICPILGPEVELRLDLGDNSPNQSPYKTPPPPKHFI